MSRMRQGQALLEYVLAAASLLVVVAILFVLVDVTIRQAIRVETLVSCDAP